MGNLGHFLNTQFTEFLRSMTLNETQGWKGIEVFQSSGSEVPPRGPRMLPW